MTGEDHSVLSTARVVLDSVADALRFVSSRGVTGHSPSNFSAIEFAVETAGAQHVSPAELSTMLVNVTTELDHFVQSPAGHESRVLVEFFSNLSAIATRDAGSGGETSPTVF